MKSFQSLMAGAALAIAAAALPTFGQGGNPTDLFGAPRVVSLGALTTMVGNAVNAVTNPAVDVRMLDGIAQVDLFFTTNAGAGTMTATLQSSADQATWSNVGSYALASSTAVIYTNYYYGTNGLTATNTWLLPGTVTTPTTATAGWATPYLLAAPFTNSGAITLTQNGVTSVGINVGDAARYLRVIFTAGGTTTNASFGGILIGRLHGGSGGAP